MKTGFVFDLDGTLIDSVYQHVIAWSEALTSEASYSRSNYSRSWAASWPKQ
jgi:beta-phosphoglucomutase-like phosphatase (HAD superfamily)